MANIVNERDLAMRASPYRIVPVQPADPGTVQGALGIKLNSDVYIWNAAPPSSPYRVQPGGQSGLTKETLTVLFSGGILSNVVVTWQLGQVTEVWDAAKQAYVFVSFQETPVTQHGIVLTSSADPNVKTVDQTSYPRSQPWPSASGGIMGYVFVSCVWSGTTYRSYKAVFEH